MISREISGRDNRAKLSMFYRNFDFYGPNVCDPIATKPLRIFPLHLEWMGKKIGIDTLRLTNALGKAFAILH